MTEPVGSSEGGETVQATDQLGTASVSEPAPSGEVAGIGSAAAISVVGSLVTTGLTIARSKVTASILGPAGIGIYAEVLQWINLANLPVGMITGVALLAGLSEARAKGDHQRARELYGIALTCALVVSTAFSMVAVVIAAVTIPRDWDVNGWELAILGGISVVVACAMSVPNQVLVAYARLARLTAFSIGMAVVQTILLCIGTFKWGLVGQFSAVLVGYVVCLPIAYRMLAGALPGPWRPILRFDIQFVRKALGVGTAGLIAGYALQGALVVMRLSLEKTGGAPDVGQFQAAWAIGSVYFTVVLGSLGNYVFPRYAAAADSKALEVEVRDAARFVGRVGPPLILMAIACRAPLIRALYSHRFDPAIHLVGTMMIGDMAKAICWVQEGPLLYRNRVRAFLIVEAIAAACLIAFTIVLVPRYGLQGIGYAYIFTNVSAALISAWILKGSEGIPIQLKTLGAAAGVTLVAGISLWLTDLTPMLSWVLGAAAIVWAQLNGVLGPVLQAARRKVATLLAILGRPLSKV